MTTTKTERIDRFKGLSKQEEDMKYEKMRKDIVKYSKKFLKDNYDLELEIPIKLNGRFKVVQGRVTCTTYVIQGIRIFKPSHIQFSKDLLRFYDEEEIWGTVKHELIHYALIKLELPHRDGDTHFENELVKHNAPSTKTSYRKGNVKVHIYQCDSCDTVYTRGRKINENRLHQYRCGKCHSNISYDKTVTKEL